MIDVLENHDPFLLARIMLAQAGIRPACCVDCDEHHCGCQYQIESFQMDVNHTVIVDRGVVRRLITWGS